MVAPYKTAGSVGSTSNIAALAAATNSGIPKHQQKFLPFLEREKEAHEEVRGKKSSKEKGKNAPSQITVMGQVDVVYHNPDPELVDKINAASSGPKLSKEDRDRIRRAREWGKKAGPIKLHHQELELNSDEEDCDYPKADTPLPPRDFITELAASGPLETRVKALQDTLQFSEFNIRSKEQELKLIKQMKALKVAQKKRLNTSDFVPLSRVDVPEKVKERPTERDRNILLESRKATEKAMVTAKATDSYLNSTEHKRVFPEKRSTVAPYCVDEKEKLPKRKLDKTYVTTGKTLMKGFVEKSTYRAPTPTLDKVKKPEWWADESEQTPAPTVRGGKRSATPTVTAAKQADASPNPPDANSPKPSASAAEQPGSTTNGKKVTVFTPSEEPTAAAAKAK